MNATELLASLSERGVQIWVDNDKLSIRSPKGVITPELQAELTALEHGIANRT
ncbi:hypothetical protein [Leptolyngbya sp. 7M]|uniref:TubC N-terminal docking domain-related protein n=1 Tax=Leptolyngbya sp. 7M TaxID=2812896 RepID=UPI001B8C1A67|nr:hypothetical protein [Leptolyngbya sp. 7M]QYO64389.1 hypothetical protein JVX88_32665 [Leptolyngbya sp. 7M]